MFEAPGVSSQVYNLVSDARPGPAAMGIRPEGISIGSGPIHAIVQLVEKTGHENIVVVLVGEYLRITGRTAANEVWQAGDSVQISIDPKQAHFFAEGPKGSRLNLPLEAVTSKEATQ